MDSPDATSPDDTMYEFERCHRSQIQDYVMRGPTTDARDIEKNFKSQDTSATPHKYNFHLLDREALRTKFHDKSTTLNARNATIAAFMNAALTNSKVTEARRGAMAYYEPLKSLHDVKRLTFTPYGFADTENKTLLGEYHNLPSYLPATKDHPHTVFCPDEEETLAKDIVRSICEELYQDQLSPKLIDRWLSQGEVSVGHDASSWGLATNTALSMLESDRARPRRLWVKVLDSESELPKPTLWENMKDQTAQLPSKISSYGRRLASQIRIKLFGSSNMEGGSPTENHAQDHLSRCQQTGSNSSSPGFEFSKGSSAATRPSRLSRPWSSSGISRTISRVKNRFGSCIGQRKPQSGEKAWRSSVGYASLA